MSNLQLSPGLINNIIDDPTILAPNSTTTQFLGPVTRNAILAGYVEGFKTLFILNAAFLALATVAGVFLIKHHELTRPDEDQLREEARLEEEKQSEEEVPLEEMVGQKKVVAA